MTQRQSLALTEFHKWLTVVGIPTVIVLQLNNLKKLDEMNLLLTRHDVKIENTIKVNEAQNIRLDKIDDRFQSLDQEAYKLSFIEHRSGK